MTIPLCIAPGRKGPTNRRNRIQQEKRMRTSSKLMLAAALIVTAVTASAGPADDQVARAFTAFNAAFNKGDAKAVAGFYTRDAIVLPPSHDVVNSSADIEKFFASLFTNHVTGH